MLMTWTIAGKAVIFAVLVWRQAEPNGRELLLISLGLTALLILLGARFSLNSSGQILIPYIVWLSIASVLNLVTVKLKSPIK
jgi:tryptophan-rich sensory protein